MDMKTFFDKARAEPFGGIISQSAVDGVEALIAAFAQYGDGDTRKLAYILGTSYHESDRFQTMEEYASGERYEGREDLGNDQAGDGKQYKGRGFVQVTGRRNYADWSRRLGVDLMADPEIAEKRPIAARICVQGMMLGTFTGKKLGDYITERSADYVNARRVVNGIDKASDIAKYARQFETALKAARFGEEPATAPIPTPRPAIDAPAAIVSIPAAVLPPVSAGLPAIVGSVNKAVGAARGAAKGSAVAPAITLIGAKLGIIPAWVLEPEYMAAFLLIGGVVIAAAWAFISTYRAPANE